ncbi:MAG: phosphoglucosamine mutase [Candidatus Merdivicinus sp.]|jgi:phosphoglucosamine mutase
MARLFGTDGVRGVAGTELTAQMCFDIGRSAAMVLTANCTEKPRILVGRDTRISGDMVQAALTAGFCAAGAIAIPVGVIPTPALAWLTREYKADAAAMISASHNPMEYNGIKFFNQDGYKLDDALEDRIEAMVRGAVHPMDLPNGAAVGTVEPVDTAVSDYISYILTTIDTRLDGIRAAVDCANGSASLTAPPTLKKLGVDVTVIHQEPNGININAGCGSTHMEDIQRLTVESGADIGLAFDGDADRLLAVDEKGNLVNGDQIMAICGTYLKSQGKLKNDTIVATIMSNLGLFQMADREGIRIPKTKVGDRYVLEKMLEEGDVLGGEQSGHVIFLDHNTTGDGLITALQLLSVMKHTGKKLSELTEIMTVLPQVVVNVPVENERKYDYIDDAEIMETIRRTERLFEDSGRVLIRPSGTEAMVRIMIEGQDLALMKEKAEEIAAVMKKNLE